MQGAASSDADSFAEWAEASLSPLTTVVPGAAWEDLRALDAMVAEARVVALSEGVHAATEPLQFRNRVLQYLVERKGFTAIAIESGVVESRVVQEYVRGAPGELSNVVQQGITWTFADLPQNAALVRWIREYNADPRHSRKVNFYGFDISGSPNVRSPTRPGSVALVEALKFLARVDAPAGASLQQRLASLLPRARYYLRNPEDAPPASAPADSGGYEQLNTVQRESLTAAIEDLIALLERKEAHYIAASSPREYAWGYRAAIGARQLDHWLRLAPIGTPPAGDADRAPGFLSLAADVRDRAQADNIEWVVQQEGAEGKVLVFAHLYHLSNAPVKTAWYSLGPGASGTQAVAGTYLERRFGPRLVTIGNVVGHGVSGCGAFGQKLDGASADTLQGQLGRFGRPLFLLDLRKASGPTRQWLDREHAFGQNSGVLQVSARAAFDILFYVDSVTPACSR